MPVTERDGRRRLRAWLTSQEATLTNATLCDDRTEVAPHRAARQPSLSLPAPRRPNDQ